MINMKVEWTAKNDPCQEKLYYDGKVKYQDLSSSITGER